MSQRVPYILQRRVGYSVVELLVVAAIVAILLGIALPTTALVRERADRAACLSRVRQIGAATLDLASSGKGYLPLAGVVRLQQVPPFLGLRTALQDASGERYRYSRTSIWPPGELPQSLPELLLERFRLTSAFGTAGVLHCPRVAQEPTAAPSVVIEVMQGAGISLASEIGTSYAPNGWLFGYSDPGVPDSARAPLAGKLSRVRQASTVVLYAESSGARYVNAWLPDRRPASMADLHPTPDKGAALPPMSRHRGHVIVAFVDGHAGEELIESRHLTRLLLSE